MTPDRFSHFLAIDWSGAAGERHKGIALALADARGGPPVLVARGRGWSRAEVLDLLLHDLPPDTLVGMDLGFSLPFADCGAFFPGWADSPPDARALWALVDRHCAADEHLGASGLVDHPQASAYFRRHGGREGELFGADGVPGGRGRFRATERAQEALGCRPYSNFNLIGAAQVGKSSLTGMRLLHRLAGKLAVWPFDPLPPGGSVLVEIYTTIAAIAGGRSAGRAKMRLGEDVDAALAALGSPPVGHCGAIDDHTADALVAAAWLRKVAHQPDLWSPPALTASLARTEGWTFGAV
ncbi:MAG: hypothetical protein ABIT10_07360 [Alteraurantiacibacter sp.]